MAERMKLVHLQYKQKNITSIKHGMNLCNDNSIM